MREWPRHFMCAYCHPSEQGRARWRFFSGVAAVGGGSIAGGYPACHAHQYLAQIKALGPLEDADCPDGWTVNCYRVEPDEHDDPVMRPLWTAKRRP